MKPVHLILMGILFLLLAALPLVVDRFLKHLRRTSDCSLLYPAYFSALLFVISLCFIPVMMMTRAPEFLFIALMFLLPCIPWLIKSRYQSISRRREDHRYFIYLLVFEAILLLLFVALLLISSLNLADVIV